jgi:uncharacterized protein YuzE
VESAGQGFTSMAVEPLLEPGLDLQDRLFGEGDGQKSGGVNTLLNQMNDPLGENHRVGETKEITENIYIDVDEKGNIVHMTIEHARANAGLWEFSYQEMSRQTA